MTKTLDQYTPDERAAMVGMWVSYALDQEPPLGIITKIDIGAEIPEVSEVAAVYLPTHACTYFIQWKGLIPRFDLHYAWTPDGTPTKGEWHAEETTFRDYSGTAITSDVRRQWTSEWEPLP